MGLKKTRVRSLSGEQLVFSNEDLLGSRIRNFKGYGAYSLDYEIVYWVLDPDYNRYMDIQKAINLEIFRRFDEMSIEFAYPTRLLYFQQQEQESREKEESGKSIEKEARLL